MVKNPPAVQETCGFIPGLGRPPRGEHGNPLQYSHLENPMDRGAWWATVHGVAKSQRLSRRAKTLFPLSLLVNVSSRVEPERNFLASQADDHFPFKSLPDLPLPSSESDSEVARSCLTLCDPVDCTRPLGPWDSPGENTGVGCHFLLQGIFPTQRSNLDLPHCRQTLYHLGLPFADLVIKRTDTL